MPVAVIWLKLKKQLPLRKPKFVLLISLFAKVAFKKIV
jgi:hypothetical protein